MITVLCVKWGTRYGPEWVVRLRNMVAANLTVPHDFVCITDEPVDGIQCVPLSCDLPGWWQKLGMFQPGFVPGWKLYLDLDVVITGDLTGMVLEAEKDPTRLWVRDDFSYSLRKPRELDPASKRLLGGNGTVNSSVMLWHGDSCADVWTRFERSHMDELHGDQNHISRVLWPHGIAFLPDAEVRSYKYHVLRGESPGSVVVFHGDPKMSDLPRSHPLRRLWEQPR